MRILLVGDYPSDPRLGSTKVLLKLQEAFRDAGHTCDLLLAEHLGLWPAHRGARWPLAPVAALAAVRRAARDNGPYDIVDVASAEGLWLGVARRLGLLGETIVIARSNGLEHLNYRRMLDDADAGLLPKPWTRRVYYPAVRLSQVAAAARTADRLIVLNDGDRRFALARGWKRDSEIDVIPHGVSSAYFAASSVDDSRRGRGILFCGSWDLVKGVTYLATAFSALVERGARIQPGGHTVALTIVGGGVPEAQIRTAFSAAAQPHVTVCERVHEADVIEAYRTHDVLAFPSTYEGFGMVLLEAMSQQLAVVTTPVGCATALVSDGRAGIAVPARDAAALAGALEAVLGDPERRARLAAEASARVRGMTWTATARATLAAYERAIASRPAFAHA